MMDDPDEILEDASLANELGDFEIEDEDESF